MHLDLWSRTRAVWAPRGHLVKYLETFVIITSEGVLLVSNRYKPRDAAQHLTMHRTAPTAERMIWSKVSIVPRLKKP